MIRNLPWSERSKLYEIAMKWQNKGVVVRLVCGKCNKILAPLPGPNIVGYKCSKCEDEWELV